MLAQTKETNDKEEGFFKGAIDAAEQVAQAGLTVERLKEKATHLIDDGVLDAKRMVKRGVYVAEDLIDDTAQRIKKDPLASVGITFGVGLGIGAFLGWFVAYKTRPNRIN